MLHKKLWQKQKKKKLHNFKIKIKSWPRNFFLGPFLFFLISPLTLSSPNQVTAFSWVSDPNKDHYGSCYEYDLETGGQKFQKKVSKEKCRPKSTRTLWVPKTSGVGGKCFEVDSETGGSNYSRVTSADRCSSENATYVWKQTGETKGECYEQSGENYQVRVDKKKCLTGSVLYHWLPKKSGWGGRCYAISEEGGPASYIESVKLELCKPDNTSFILNQTKTNLEGECFEVDALEGRGSYSNSVSREKCLSKEVRSFLWKKDETGINGKCLELQKSLSGVGVVKEVSYKKCIDFETTHFFKRLDRLAGVCLLVDKNSGGESFSKIVSKSHCLKIAGETEKLLLQKRSGKYQCYQVDTKTNGNLFIDMAPSADCEERLGKPVWVSDETLWDGKCVVKTRVGLEVKEKSIAKEKCRPSDVFVMWHNIRKLKGYCYEVHGKYGSEKYAVIIEKKKCKTKIHKYIFYRAPGEQSGNCYMVDAKTGGEKYNKKVGAEKCKEKLMVSPIE